MKPVGLNRGGDGLDDFRVGQHSDLAGIDLQVIKDGGNLRFEELDRRCVNSSNTNGVLCGKRSNRRSAVNPKNGEGLQVGLYAGAPGTIRSCNRQSDGRRLSVVDQFSKLFFMMSCCNESGVAHASTCASQGNVSSIH